jgi:hypothetical protein
MVGTGAFIGPHHITLPQGQRADGSLLRRAFLECAKRRSIMDHDTLEEKNIWIFMDNQAAVQGLLKAAP